MFTLRYYHEAPAQPRPHGPTAVTFETEAEANAHLANQPNSTVLQVVIR